MFTAQAAQAGSTACLTTPSDPVAAAPAKRACNTSLKTTSYPVATAPAELASGTIMMTDPVGTGTLRAGALHNHDSTSVRATLSPRSFLLGQLSLLLLLPQA